MTVLAAAPAATSVAPEPTPAKATEAAETPPPNPPKPRTIDDDLEDVLKRHGGYEYAKGKKLDSAANLKRMLGRVTGVESAAVEALKVKQGDSERAQKVASLAKMRPLERIEALKSMGFDSQVLREAFEEDILAQDDHQRAEATMSERERELARQVKKQDAELSEHRSKAEAAAAADKESAFIAETDKLYGEMVEASARAFELAGFAKGSPALVAAVLPALAERIDRDKRLGLGIDAAELADVVVKGRGRMADEWNAARPMEDLSAALEAIQVDHPEQPGKKISKLKLLMLHEAAKLRGRVAGNQQPPVVRAAPAQQSGSSQTMAEKMATARTFGGGSR